MLDMLKADRSRQKVSAQVNLTVADWDPSRWNDLSPEQAIHSLFVYADTEARKAVAWYEKAKHRKALASRWLRGIAIVFFIIGGLAPILAGFIRDDNGAREMVAITQSGLMALAIAAGLIAFDRFFGMSSGWIRYMTSLAAIDRLRGEFLLDWTALLQDARAPIDDATRLIFLERAQTFQQGVIELVEKETAAWVAEFQSSVADLEKLVAAQRKATEASTQAARKHEDRMRARRGEGGVRSRTSSVESKQPRTHRRRGRSS
jgi:hypothetical protein